MATQTIYTTNQVKAFTAHTIHSKPTSFSSIQERTENTQNFNLTAANNGTKSAGITQPTFQVETSTKHKFGPKFHKNSCKPMLPKKLVDDEDLLAPDCMNIDCSENVNAKKNGSSLEESFDSHTDGTLSLDSFNPSPKHDAKYFKQCKNLNTSFLEDCEKITESIQTKKQDKTISTRFSDSELSPKLSPSSNTGASTAEILKKLKDPKIAAEISEWSAKFKSRACSFSDETNNSTLARVVPDKNEMHKRFDMAKKFLAMIDRNIETTKKNACQHESQMDISNRKYYAAI